MTITLTREEAQQVLDAMETSTFHLRNHCDVGVDEQLETIKKTQLQAETLRARLAQPEPEPVAWTDAPERIYLQVCDEIDCEVPFSDHVEVSWCQDKINDSDIEYIRADTAPPQRECKFCGKVAKP